jgi:hypothetical protein
LGSQPLVLLQARPEVGACGQDREKEPEGRVAPVKQQQIAWLHMTQVLVGQQALAFCLGRNDAIYRDGVEHIKQLRGTRFGRCRPMP